MPSMIIYGLPLNMMKICGSIFKVDLFWSILVIAHLVPLDEQANLAVQLAFRFQTHLDGHAGTWGGSNHQILGFLWGSYWYILISWLDTVWVGRRSWKTMVPPGDIDDSLRDLLNRGLTNNGKLKKLRNHSKTASLMGQLKNLFIGWMIYGTWTKPIWNQFPVSSSCIAE